MASDRGIRSLFFRGLFCNSFFAVLMLRHPERCVPPAPDLPSHPASARHAWSGANSRLHNRNTHDVM